MGSSQNGTSTIQQVKQVQKVLRVQRVSYFSRITYIQNSAALRSFDSVLLFQIIHFLTYDVFSAQDDEMRRTTPVEP